MDVLIIGARRSGTTSLYNLLGQHSKIRLAGPSPWQEVHFFDNHLNLSRGMKWYENKWAWTDKGEMRVDKSPTYLHCQYAPARAAKAVPDAKVLAILRHPVDRAVSDYWKRVSERYEERTLEEAVEKEAETSHYYHGNAPYWMSPRHLFAYLERSDYWPQLNRWVEYFTGQIMLLQFEYFIRNTQEAMDVVFEFLGLDTIPLANLELRWQHVKRLPMKPQVENALAHALQHVCDARFPFAVGSYKWRT